MVYNFVIQYISSNDWWMFDESGKADFGPIITEYKLQTVAD